MSEAVASDQSRKFFLRYTFVAANVAVSRRSEYPGLTGLRAKWTVRCFDLSAAVSKFRLLAVTPPRRQTARLGRTDNPPIAYPSSCSGISARGCLSQLRLGALELSRKLRKSWLRLRGATCGHWWSWQPGWPCWASPPIGRPRPLPLPPPGRRSPRSRGRRSRRRGPRRRAGSPLGWRTLLFARTARRQRTSKPPSAHRKRRRQQSKQPSCLPPRRSRP